MRFLKKLRSFTAILLFCCVETYVNGETPLTIKKENEKTKEINAMNTNEKKELNISELEQVNGGMPDLGSTPTSLDVETWKRSGQMIKAVLQCIFN